MSRITWRLPDRELVFHRALVMGIVNVTPDSFSDGGRFFDPSAAVAHAMDLVYQGADILDIGGESTRPGAAPVDVLEELRRVQPVVYELARQTHVPISVDTQKVEVARQCLDAGALVINDITALQDPAMVDLVRQTRAGVILMHMQGTPETMQQKPQYEDVVIEIDSFFDVRLRELEWAGMNPDQMVIDPGIGFGKTDGHNLQILAGLSRFQRFGRPVCLGVSRKGFIGRLTNRPVEERMAGSIAAASYALVQGSAQILRVHDVAATRDAVAVLQGIKG